jgi:hypothetical protein
VLSVPVRLADQPVGTLDVDVTQPRAWTTGEVEALGALAVVTAELVSTGVELANREVEVAQLRQALANRVWIEQAKGVLAVTRGVGPDQAFQQLRRRARSSSRRLADLAQEVVQDAQRERIAALAVDDARVRAAEARAQQAEQALQAAQTGLADAPPPWTGTGTTSTCGSGPPTSATTSPTNASRPPTSATTAPTLASRRLMSATIAPTNATAMPTSATGPPAIPSSAVGWTKRQQGTSEAAPNGCGRGGGLRVRAQPSPPKQVGS